MRRICGARTWAVLGLALVAFGPTVAAPAPVAATSASVRVVRWIDGDTVVTTAGRVRLIGVDTPELGECGHRRATRDAARLAPAGTAIRLTNPASVQDKDAYGRLLRFVDRGRFDVGLRQIRAGAVARYDGRDGYDRHPRQDRYRAADSASNDYCSATVNPPPPPPVDLSSYPPVSGTWNCPSNAPIKGNRGEPEWIYHLPTNTYYGVTKPEECFATEAAAVAHGYRAAKV